MTYHAVAAVPRDARSRLLRFSSRRIACYEVRNVTS